MQVAAMKAMPVPLHPPMTENQQVQDWPTDRLTIQIQIQIEIQIIQILQIWYSLESRVYSVQCTV